MEVNIVINIQDGGPCVEGNDLMGSIKRRGFLISLGLNRFSKSNLLCAARYCLTSLDLSQPPKI